MGAAVRQSDKARRPAVVVANVFTSVTSLFSVASRTAATTLFL
jgi:hypothetical protein